VVILSEFIVDTDVFSYFFKRDPKASFFNSYVQKADIYITFASLGELYFGAFKNNWGERKLKEIEVELSNYIVIFTNRDICRLYAKIRVQCKQQPIDDIDYWIAACARFYDIPLLTNNWKHFNGIDGLKLISPGHVN
jgi:tRNA(fMet)-specific endonuclease VapC